jgi:hypothetical protein
MIQLNYNIIKLEGLQKEKKKVFTKKKKLP